MAVETALKPLATKTPWVICGISRAQWYKLDAEGKTPAAARLGTQTRVWLISDIQAWLAAGAPNRSTWESRKLLTA